jgi:hypothetical protein
LRQKAQHTGDSASKQDPVKRSIGNPSKTTQKTIKEYPDSGPVAWSRAGGKAAQDGSQRRQKV